MAQAAAKKVKPVTAPTTKAKKAKPAKVIAIKARNSWLTPAKEAALDKSLLTAVKSGDNAKILDVLQEISAICNDKAEEKNFVCAFSNWTKTSAKLIALVRENQLSFWLGWTEDGTGNVLPESKEINLPKEKVKQLQKEMTTLLEQDDWHKLDAFAGRLARTCKKAGIRSFQTTLKDGSEEASRMIGAMLKQPEDDRVFLKLV
mgnify:CR=1 FL=1